MLDMIQTSQIENKATFITPKIVNNIFTKHYESMVLKTLLGNLFTNPKTENIV